MSFVDFHSAVLLADLVLREIPDLMVVLAVLWLLILGGSVGSFLNVVIYRLPQGVSLVRPRSRCPRCFTPILPRDNVPVLGWLMLRGRCRACGSPISARYPLVELAVALIFLSLAWCEPLGNAMNLPIPRSAAPEYPLWGLLLYHFALMCGLTAAALMMFDGEAVPRKFWFGLWLGGFAAGAIWPLLRPVGIEPFDPEWSGLVFGLVEGAAGTLLGLVLGCAAWPASTAVGHGRAGNVAGPAMLAVVGVYLGWQAAAVLSVAAATLWSAWQLVRYLTGLGADVGWPMIVAVATLVWLFAWRAVVVGASIAGQETAWYWAPAAAGLTFAASLAGRTLADAVRRRIAAS